MKEFVIVIAVAVFILACIAFHHYGWGWRKTKSGRRVLFGLIVAPLLAALVGLIGGCARVDVFAGLESTKNLSPQCEDIGASNRITSNLGIEGCRGLSSDGRTEICGVYRHHSCAISIDRETYDAVGFQVKRTIWAQ